jgi:hypothetical protein
MLIGILFVPKYVILICLTLFIILFLYLYYVYVTFNIYTYSEFIVFIFLSDHIIFEGALHVIIIKI